AERPKQRGQEQGAEGEEHGPLTVDREGSCGGDRCQGARSHEAMRAAGIILTGPRTHSDLVRSSGSARWRISWARRSAFARQVQLGMNGTPGARPHYESCELCNPLYFLELELLIGRP